LFDLLVLTHCILILSYNVTIREDVSQNTELLTVKARSQDTGLNNIIKYRITDVGSGDKLFSIDPDTGE